ncbi:hypothetical protein PG993_013319 [Apiospora rasikravindrae]|uniref:Uncharacterized protein n=1 Tax=Apiospora rasikravindrae TaxID=990691 RepID=A0ABR1RYJ3_9PEZI
MANKPQPNCDAASYPAEQDQAKTFLHLPWPVRRRIYIEAGLLVGQDIILQRRSGCILQYGDTRSDDAYRFVYSILQTCRTINDEVRGLIYAENRIIVDIRNVIYGLVHLRSLSPRHCSQLRFLYVHLYLEVPPDPIRYKKDKLFRRPVLLERGCIIEAWQAAANHVLAHANREALQLHLICDTGDRAVTTRALEPLTAHPASLQGCEIRLASKRNDKLCSLARDVALRAKGMDGHVHDDKPFRFMDLPPEIRSYILEYTGLVTPCKEVEWRPGRRGYSVTLAEHSTRHRHDSNYTTTRRESEGWWRFVNCQPPHHDTRRTGAICIDRQSGYAPRCQCWMPPQALMLVSRALYDEAIATLYTQNRAIRRRHRRRRRLSAEHFLARHHAFRLAAALSQLRTLEVVFPGLIVGEPGGGRKPDAADPLCAAWRTAVRHLREQQGAGLSGLTLLVHMRLAAIDARIRAPGYEHRMREANGDPCTWQISTVDGRGYFERYVEDVTERRGADEKGIWTVHAALLEPLRELRAAGLRRLFVFLESGWHWSPPRGCTPQTCQGQRDGEVHGRIREMEQALEKGVMGEEYDSAAEGKMEELPSQWMHHVE